MENKCIRTTCQRCALKACHCYRALHFVAVEGSQGFMAYALFFFSLFLYQGSPSIRTALPGCLHGNQGTPILITSVLSPRLPWHLTEIGPEKSFLRLSVSIVCSKRA